MSIWSVFDGYLIGIWSAFDGYLMGIGFTFFPFFLFSWGKKEKSEFTFFLFSFFPEEKRKKGKKWVHFFPFFLFSGRNHYIWLENRGSLRHINILIYHHISNFYMIGPPCNFMGEKYQKDAPYFQFSRINYCFNAHIL